MLLPHTMRFNAGMTGERAPNITQALGGGEASSPVDQVSFLLDQMGIPRRLRDAGVAQEDLDGTATLAMDDWFLGRNPRTVQGVAELKELLLSAW